MNCKAMRGVVRLERRRKCRRDQNEVPRAVIQTVQVPAVCHKLQTGWRRLVLRQARTAAAHRFPDSSNLSNQPNPLPRKTLYLCMQYTPISAHSGMPTYYGGLLGDRRSAAVVTRRFRLLARYCFLFLVRGVGCLGQQ